MEVKRIVFTVTNDLNYDQRMMRICTSLSNAGYKVTLVGRLKHDSTALQEKTYNQKRLNCFSQKGKFFYIEYNIRLFFYLLFIKTDALCAIDLDTILPVLWTSMIRKIKRIYDAHELFCEMQEIVSRPTIYTIWKRIEKYAVPKFTNGYTIGEFYAKEFYDMYKVKYEVVRNATILKPLEPSSSEEKYILYQGAVNEGRSFETLIPAMKAVNAKLIICGEGNYFEQAKALVTKNNLEEKVIFKGHIPPAKLQTFTRDAFIGITLFTETGKSNYLSLANRFFDYMHAAVPQLCVSYPEYKKVNEKFEISYLIENTHIETISKALNELLLNRDLHARLKSNCHLAREEYCWQKQENTLINFYNKILG